MSYESEINRLDCVISGVESDITILFNTLEFLSRRVEQLEKKLQQETDE